MKYNMNYKLKIVCGTLLFLLIGCQVPGGGGSPFDMHPSIPVKKLQTNDFPVEFVSYVDVGHYNPLNAKDYVFGATAETGETQFFNYVVLGYSWLTKAANGSIQVEMTPSLKYILDNSTTYIKPLHQKGIQVLIEVRSGNFSDTEDGIGVGLGTLDMATIEELIKDLKLIVNQYGIDGFDFNDVGGGKKAYPPLTRDLTQFRSPTPLYPERLFKNKEDGSPLTPAEIEAVLWTEGGSNLSNLVQNTNEILKETYTSILEGEEDDVVKSIDRIILVRNKNHGSYLLSELRDDYMPDAYSGAKPKTTGNLRYIVNDTSYDNTKPHASLWEEDQATGVKEDVGEDYDTKYAPFAVDLADQKDKDTAEKWAKTFLYKNPDTSSSPNRYGALYFTNLPPVSDTETTGKIAPAAYMTYFSQALFGRTTRLAETPNTGDYKKTW